jgi:hypothetical protein
MERAVAAAILAILVAASFGAGYLARGIQGTTSSISTSTSNSQRTTAPTMVSTSSTVTPSVPGAASTVIDSNASTGLDLVLASNATTIKVGQKLNIDISLFNSLPSAISMPASQDWPFKGVPVALWPACYGTTPAYAVVLKGNYTLQGVESVANITVSYQCMEGAGVDHVVFQPSSSQAYLTGSGFGPSPGPYELSLNFTTGGYWDLLNNSQQLNPPIIGQQNTPPIATPFTPGVYTLAVADEWGQAGVLHVTVEDG